MKSLVCVHPGKLEFIAGKRPALEKGHAIIRIRRVGICGTDLHAYEGTQPYFTYPRILGHELAGELLEFDKAPGFTVGEIVSCIPYFNCGSCFPCRTGNPNCCEKLKVCGVHIDGGMTEYLSVPSKALLHGEGLSFDELSLLEPLAIGAHGVGRARITKGEFVLVIGAGPIGLATMEFARIAGGKVIAMDVNEQRLQFCIDKLKTPYVVNARWDDVMQRLLEITNRDMPAVVMDATGNLNSINHAFQFMAHGGRYVLIGLQKENISFSHPEFHKKEGTLMSSRNARQEDFEQVRQALKAGQVNPTTFITHRVAFDEVISNFENWLNPANGVIKAMVELN